MTVTRIRLFDGDRELVLGGRDHTRDDILVHRIDPGSPAVRAVVEDRTGADGQYDTTRHYSGRTVAVEATIWSLDLLREISTYLSPRLRPCLGVTDPDIYPGERFLLLRRDNFSPGPINHMSHIRRPLQFQWACPTGVWEATAPVEVGVNAAGGTTAGIAFPSGFPWVFQATAGVGQVLHTNPGTTWSDQVVRLYGPCVGPRWSNDATGETIAFTEDLVIPLGEYIEVNTRDRTAYYLSDPNADRLGYLDFDLSTWWQVPPGESKLRYHPIAEVDAGCTAVVSHRPAWL